jgi:hypothetical protein
LSLRERNPDRSHKDLVTLGEVKMWVGEENLASILSSQGDDIMVEYIERETLSEVSPEIQLEEVVSPLEEIPSMVKLDAPQLREVVFLIFGAEGIVENGCREDYSGANSTSDKLAVLASQDGRVESGHEMVREEGRKGHTVLFPGLIVRNRRLRRHSLRLL